MAFGLDDFGDGVIGFHEKRPRRNGTEQGRLPALPIHNSASAARLALDLLADVFNGFAELPATTAKAFLNASGGLVGYPFIMQAFVVRQIARGLLHLCP